MICQEATEQVLDDKGLEQVEVWVAAGLGRVGVEAAVAKEVVLRQDRGDIVSVLTAVKKQPINWEAPVMSKNAQSVERP